MIGIVVLNYNTWHETEKCIKSIIKTTDNVKYHIYLVDNASPVKMTDNVEKMIQLDNITYIQAEVNRGFSAGNNLGVYAALEDECSEILISNNDVYYSKGSIKKMQDFLLNNTNVGIVGPEVRLRNDEIQEVMFGIKTTLSGKYKYLLRKTPFKFLVRDFLEKFTIDHKKINSPIKVHSVIGCSFMVSKECTKEIFPLDENTFLYEEERIIGIKMENIGYDTVYYPEVNVFHDHGASTKGLSSFSYSCLVESEIYYLKKYLNNKNIEIIPLYIIRTFKYLILSVRNRIYRKNILKYFKKTLAMF